MAERLKAELIWADGALRADHVVVVGDDGAIARVGALTDGDEAEHDIPLVDLGRAAILPGTVNAHNHSFQSLLRGIADDRPFLTWRDEALYQYAPKLGVEGIYTGAVFAFGEMLLRGVTTVCDFFYLQEDGNAGCEAVIRAAEDVGIRLVLARTMYDWDGAPSLFRETIDEAVANTHALHAATAGHPRVSVLPAPHSPHAASPDMIKAGAALAETLGTPFHIHVAEEPFEVEETLRDHGHTPVRYLDSLGVLGPRACLVHCVHVDQGEVTLMGARGCGLLYNPNSNMFLGDGITPLTEMVEAGVTVALGTDGGCSNSRVSVFDEMRAAALLQKVRHQDGAALSAESVFRMGTEGGARLVQQPVGDIAAGLRADLVVVDLDDLSLQPAIDVLKNVVYSMEPTAIRAVMVEGSWVARDGDLLTLARSEIVARVRALTADWRAAGG